MGVLLFSGAKVGLKLEIKQSENSNTIGIFCLYLGKTLKLL